MIQLLRDKKVIFFDVGYTLDRPASGDWLFTRLFLEMAGEKLKACGSEETGRAWNAGLRWLTDNHLLICWVLPICYLFGPSCCSMFMWLSSFHK